jgi:hypothetical protein
MKLIKTVGFLMMAVFIITQISYAYNGYDWVFIYYMPYDNDLNRYGEIILGEISKGVYGANNIAVVVQADFKDSEGMRRISFSNGKRKTEDPPGSENSADEKEYEKYLNWVKDNWPADNYAVVLLGHAGGLDSICLDDDLFEQTKKGKGGPALRKWMNARRVGNICKKFNQDTGQKVKLLFLQQCGRGSLENVYNFMDSADYILASPVKIYAREKNTYYAEMLRQVAKKADDLSGEDIARIIVAEDRRNTYTLIENSKLHDLPEKLNGLLDTLKENKINLKSLNIPKLLEIVFEPPETLYNEKNYDVEEFLHRINNVRNIYISRAINEFSGWYKTELIPSKHFEEDTDVQLAGLSLFIPSSREQLKKTSLLLFNETCIDDIFELLLK